MIDNELADRGLETLSVAIAIMLEEAHADAASQLPASVKARAAGFAHLRSVGADVAALASAMQVLERRRAAE